ncbi:MULTISPECIES: hypothetical protein [Halobacterium]|uniref:DUF7344 domain-containing protein n=1 Tax=Halobacterium TaxID=2239 RepID=UPI00073F07A6|nr:MULTISPECIES: hypothetical protein [Halobacterium]MCG1004478.1 hypothetical protein [Halobacterium noricense]
MADDSDGTLPEADIHDVLRNERRRMVIELLGDAGEPVTVRELSEAIAARETGEDPPPRDVRQSVYISLQQTHVPKLAKLGIASYDEQTKELRPAENAPTVGVYMEVVPKYGLSYAEYYAALGVLGALLVVAAEVGVPVVSEVGASAYALGVFTLLVASAVYQAYSQRSTLVHRLRD